MEEEGSGRKHCSGKWDSSEECDKGHKCKIGQVFILANTSDEDGDEGAIEDKYDEEETQDETSDRLKLNYPST